MPIGLQAADFTNLSKKNFAKLLVRLLANTHSESSITGTTMTLAYHEAHKIIKDHVNAGKDDVIITAGSGMTTVVMQIPTTAWIKNSGTTCRLFKTS